jgi:hypothetical protein
MPGARHDQRLVSIVRLQTRIDVAKCSHVNVGAVALTVDYLSAALLGVSCALSFQSIEFALVGFVELVQDAIGYSPIVLIEHSFAGPILAPFVKSQSKSG